MIDMDYILNGKRSKQKNKSKDSLQGLMTIFNPKPNKKSKQPNLIKSFLGQGNPMINDRKTKSQKRFLRSSKGFKKNRFKDSDKDGVIDGLDCFRHNPKKHMAWKRPEDYDYIEEMSPREYLNRTNSPNFGLKDKKFGKEWSDKHGYKEETYSDSETKMAEPLSKLSNKITDNTSEVPIPYVEPDGDHEGRHRALAAERAGIKKIPVKTSPPKSWRSDKVVSGFNEKRFSGYDDDYKETWRKRIQQDVFPEKRIYLEIGMVMVLLTD